MSLIDKKMKKYGVKSVLEEHVDTRKITGSLDICDKYVNKVLREELRETMSLGCRYKNDVSEEEYGIIEDIEVFGTTCVQSNKFKDEDWIYEKSIVNKKDGINVYIDKNDTKCNKFMAIPLFTLREAIDKFEDDDIFSLYCNKEYTNDTLGYLEQTGDDEVSFVKFYIEDTVKFDVIK